MLLLAGCSDIPTSGEVQPGPTQDVKNQDVVLVPYPPAQGASPADIVQGFLTAATGQQQDYPVARDFLTPALRSAGTRAARVLIHDQSWQLKVISDTSVTVTVPTTAEVDAEGIYTSFPEPKNLPVPFTAHEGERPVADREDARTASCSARTTSAASSPRGRSLLRPAVGAAGARPPLVPRPTT